MKDGHAYATMPIAELYEWFATEAEPTSPIWGRLCRWIAAQPALCALLDSLPGTKRQPNLFLGAIRYFDGPTEPGSKFEAWVRASWAAIAELIGRRATQTNESGRCAVLAPLLAALPQPITMLEAGAAAGLCLLPDHYRYRYLPAADAADEKSTRNSDFGSKSRDFGVACRIFVNEAFDTAGEWASPNAPLLECVVRGALPADPARLRIAKRQGLDANPLAADDPDDARWLRALVWPGEDAREARLAAALEVAAKNPPPISAGLLPEDLDDLLAAGESSAGTTVLMHSAMLAYLTRAQRADFEAHVRASGVRWVSFEGPSIVPSMRDRLPLDPRPHFLLGLDGEPVAVCSPHGAWADWL